MPPTPVSSPSALTLRSAASVVGLLALATGGAFALDHQVSLTSQAMLYVLVVVVAAYRLPLLPSVLCAVGAVTAFNFFFVPPRWTFAVDNQEHLIALVTMLLVALVISHLANGLRRETELARSSEARARQLQELATTLAGATDAPAVRDLGQQALDAAFAGPNHIRLLQSSGSLEGDTAPDVVDGLRCCMRERAVLGPGTGRWPGLNAWYLPLGDAQRMHGAVCIENIQAADTAGREHAQALCALLTQTLGRVHLAAAMLASEAERQRQQVQSTFLAAISHDLRTPLAAVVGAASALQAQRDKLGTAEQDRLLQSILSEASYLSTVTENTLQLVQLVQLTNAAQPLHRDWESMEEIVGSVLARTRGHDPSRRIHSRVPEGLPLIQADPVLLAQLLGNLLDNALKYSDGVIELAVQLRDGWMEMAVKDRGAPIPPETYAAIFQPYTRNDQSGQRGAGLGLALCRVIAQAHGGDIVVRARSGGGNSFTLRLPNAAQQPPGELS
ncbi:MAG: DUF4118 domain-containing protein [Burkholderiales bacterium]|nr:DUF4118 domain-containing protein [Burkholderiales bacterium]